MYLYRWWNDLAKYTKIGGMKKDKSRHQKSFQTLGENIRNVRKSKNISQEELAFRISSARNYIGCIERNEKIPSIAVILDIRNALNCDLNELIQNM